MAVLQEYSIFSKLALLVLAVEIVVYLGALISPSFIGASKRRALLKFLRNSHKVKALKHASLIVAACVGLLFLESLVQIIRKSNLPNDGTSNSAIIVRVTAERDFAITSFTAFATLAVFIKLKDKNSYLKLLERLESNDSKSE
ncbi:uncharacterized protein BJ171DRAFT_499913 [Polychytrium aggregatum]|uniref:uncharacterized protein n=1 Tax=Polychytrium aggregatum TaxID=110093 RepID=UPI0022FE9F1D|nr:uncharacterized protein BJ171DRAFT_499913 [Polychytrium aggregatum]KAI9205855.1 hypothetical protein BJ171DRAFT_499913 [Polychytrium aggregatum]